MYNDPFEQTLFGNKGECIRYSAIPTYVVENVPADGELKVVKPKRLGAQAGKKRLSNVASTQESTKRIKQSDKQATSVSTSKFK